MSAIYHDPARHITDLHVDEEILDLEYTREIMVRAKDRCRVHINHRPPALAGDYPENLHQGKRHLYLTANRGRFFKPCPGTREYRCCGYQVLNVGMGCPMDCVYCILQAYLNNPWISFFVNIHDLFAELDDAGRQLEQVVRIGTGEFTDSLALDSLTGLSRHLVQYIGQQRHMILELKTKSVVIDNLRDLDHQGKTIVSWSLNAPEIVAREELRAAPLDRRLEAARKCIDWGYRVGFHFDPIILYPGWQEGYLRTIQMLFEQIPADKIVWISLGALRYLPPLKQIAGQRFPGSRFFYHEFVTGLDGKQRYVRQERVETYRVLVEALQHYAHPATCLYFCMENDTVWQQVFGFTPGSRGGLPAMLDEAVLAVG